MLLTRGMRRDFRHLSYKHCSSDQPKSSLCPRQYLNYFVLLPLHPLIVLCKLFHLIARDPPNIGDLRFRLVGGFFRGNHRHEFLFLRYALASYLSPSQRDFVTLSKQQFPFSGVSTTHRNLKRDTSDEIKCTQALDLPSISSFTGLGQVSLMGIFV